uniref:zona pellucida sperm-binding protein 4-like isoform X2 n=1 Tax=Epinephelus lanceolatus TaxID=310571 RepID=UPI0014451F03|nr:zona pellucida sperm-binding protein 4-like isoform X2 [Epinephelus lanceolatus]
MAKSWRVTSLVALALLGCLVGTQVGAQDSVWSASSLTKGAPPPQAPQVRQPPAPQRVYEPRPQVSPPQPQYSQAPKVQPPPSPPKVYEPRPQVLPPRPQVYVPRPQVLPSQPQYSQGPKHFPYPRAFTDFQSPQEPQAPQPYEPYQPEQPHQPYQPYQPEQPHQPYQPNKPEQPHQPYQPTKPQQPHQPYQPTKPQQSHQPYQPQQPHQPTSPQAPSKHQPSFQSCEVAENQKVPCGGPDITAATCEAISCCFDGRQCYFGKAVTVQCTKDAQFIVVVARDATLPNIDLESISLLGQGQGCTHVDSNSEFAIYQFPVTACGSIVMEEPGVIIYENRMVSSFEVGVGLLGVITRDSYFELLFQCRYTGTSVETVVVEVLPLDNPPLPVAALGPIRVHMRLANGQCNTKGCNEVEVAYSSFYTDADYPVTKVLRDPVYVEVQLLEKTDPNLVLTLGRCWTTTSSNPHSLPQWDILTDGCPYRDDRYLSSLVPVGLSSGLDFPSHYRRFIFKMFTFVDTNSMEPMKEQVYIHCSTAVCTAAAGHSCEPSCYRRKRDVKDVDWRRAEPQVVVSSGPVIMSSPQQ